MQESGSEVLLAVRATPFELRRQEIGMTSFMRSSDMTATKKLEAFRAAALKFLTALLATAGPSFAAPPRNLPPQTAIDITFPAGIACPSFDLRIQSDGPAAQVNKEFYDRNGNVVRMFFAGKGWDLTFTNAQTGASLFVKGNGTTSNTHVAPSGLLTVQASGHTGLIMFPTDVPQGPTSTLYSGRLVYTVDANFVTTLTQISGKSTDVCAVLGD
jgi:hypothetical protein